MIQLRLIRELASRCYSLDLKSAEVMVTLFFKEIMEALSEGKKITLRGFGTFNFKIKPAHVSFNPRTRQKVQVERRKLVSFKASRLLLKSLNQGEKE